MVKHMFGRLVAMVIIPVLTYLALFYIHLSILWKAGPHDNIMTSAFQASLEVGCFSVTVTHEMYMQLIVKHSYFKVKAVGAII